MHKLQVEEDGAPRTEDQEPAAHAAQDVEPINDQEPAPHVAQVLVATAPIEVDQVPALQLVHRDAPA